MTTIFFPPFSFSSKSIPYFSLPQAEDGPEPLQSQQEKRNQRQQQQQSIWPSKTLLSFWIFMSLFFACTTTWLTAELHAVRKHGSFAQGFRSELDAAKHLIKVKTVDFGGSPRFKEDGTEYVPVPSDGEAAHYKAYVGTPRREIDHNWALLHWGRFFLLTEQEAKSAWGDEYKQFWSPKHGGYVVALEVMHTLHCLDHIRKAFYPDHYPVDSDIHGTLHRDHCLDHLRQTVLCNADLTPIPSRYYKALGQNYIDSDRPHTCRDFGRIREWVSERFNGSLKVEPAPGTVVEDEWRNGGPSGGGMGMEHEHGHGNV
ncbi:hypothetical protein GE21DRAFT_10623 [Neurospora crassa]|uniref:DUF3328 domain-containing protein n=1 Tax=Neurospora crassa (strain ATCC 24698 / 74-OR23-1A / CBS 708.71 / DSM 1257 / FGSC 987) TaxID=367110 RepID=Q7S4R2_NEUCR|nr:hypothetical protein NCU05761 [Neurospora crassa OR74A]EAA30500.3 hypothetical protein NCU05761 [Neurospora crassa OR74A]KHE86664.1 hypothetical protein GE21DRAFT_10623 [Neurospora crassa]|eukprot:XP_959736.3 hypothetical protein NCU05761 [Neurospora crassa OR74A]